MRPCDRERMERQLRDDLQLCESRRRLAAQGLQSLRAYLIATYQASMPIIELSHILGRVHNIEVLLERGEVGR